MLEDVCNAIKEANRVAALEARVAELEAGIANHHGKRLPHMTNADDRALWSLIESK